MHIPRKRLFWVVGLGHLTNDVFMSMSSVILAFLSASVLPMSNTQIGFAISATQLAGALSQPFFGWRADRSGGRWLAAGGVAWNVSLFVLAIFLAVTTHEYWLLFIPLVLRGLGSGAFHPVGSLHAAEAEREHVAGNMALFFLAGQMGLAIGPALAGFLLDLANPAGPTPDANFAPLFALALAAVPGVLGMAFYIPNHKAHRDNMDALDADKPVAPRLAIPWRAFAILGLLVGLRSLAQPGSVAFIPVLFQQKGWDPAQYGLITSFFWVAAGISGVYFGHLADRYDRRRVIMWSLVTGAVAYFLLPLFDNALAFVLAIAAGGLTGGSHSIIVVLAQELIPASKGFASGAILGFIFGMGALGSFIIGSISDGIGLGTTFQLVAISTAIAGLLALVLPSRNAQVEEN